MLFLNHNVRHHVIRCGPTLQACDTSLVHVQLHRREFAGKYGVGWYIFLPGVFSLPLGQSCLFSLVCGGQNRTGCLGRGWKCWP